MARAFVDGWRRHGLDIDLASLTYPGEYRYVPEYLAAQGWVTVERNVWRGSADDLAVIPGFVTATRT